MCKVIVILICCLAPGDLLFAQSRSGKSGEESAAKVMLPTPKEFLSKNDANGDRQLSYEELRKFRIGRAFFARVDENRDSYVDLEEIRRKSHRGRVDLAAFSALRPLTTLSQKTPITLFDENTDGGISPKEYRAYVFVLADQNGDEELAPLEVDYLLNEPSFRYQFKSTEEVLQKYDRSGDRTISRKEFKVPGEVFRKVDGNNDGTLSPDELFHYSGGELAAFANSDVDVLIEELDGNDDGKLSLSELPGGRGSGLARLDFNKDSFIDRDELARELNKLQEQQLRLVPPSFLDRYDLNGDRSVSRKEFAGPASVFDRMDSNGDGSINRKDG